MNNEFNLIQLIGLMTLSTGLEGSLDRSLPHYEHCE